MSSANHLHVSSPTPNNTQKRRNKEHDYSFIEEARAVEAGGTIVQSKHAIGEHGFVAIDTEGNMIGLHSAAS